MNTPPDRDADFLAELADVLSTRPYPPAAVVDAARELFTWRSVDAELAAITFDSLLDTVGATRADGGSRLLTFAAADNAVDVEVVTTTSGHRLIGQITPAAPAAVSLRHRADVVEQVADELGRFVIDVPVGSGRVTLSWSVPGGSSFVASVLVL